MGLAEELERIAALAAEHAEPGEGVSAVLAAEPAEGVRVYVCAFESRDEERTWLALDESGRPIEERSSVREAVSIAALCEIAAEAAGGGDLEDLRAQLLSLRLSEQPPGIEEAEEAALQLERAVGSAPRVASPGYLDDVGAATRRLEQALGSDGASPFAETMTQAIGAVDALTKEVERNYKRVLVSH